MNKIEVLESYAPPIKLKGTITEYSVSRGQASFVLSEKDQSVMGVIAISAALAGLSGPAISTATNSANVDEDADFVQFTLDGQPVKGWLWRSPFKNGDNVEAAVEWQGEHYELFGLARPIDSMIALYPHCSRGRKRHIRNIVFWWIWLGLLAPCAAMFGIMFSIMGHEVFHIKEVWMSFIFIGAFCAVMFASLGKKWMPFVVLAEKIFATLDLPNPGDIDLVRSAKEKRIDSDTGEYGTFYFRY